MAAHAWKSKSGKFTEPSEKGAFAICDAQIFKN